MDLFIGAERVARPCKDMDLREYEKAEMSSDAVLTLQLNRLCSKW